MRIAKRWAISGVLVVFATGAVGATASQQRAAVGPTYKKVGSWGKVGTANGQFGNNAYGLAADKAGNVYVADTDNHRVQVFTSKGGFLRKIAFSQSESVEDVAIDPDGNTWATSLQARQGRQFSSSGASLASIDTPKSALGIAVDAEGNVWVATAGDNIHTVVRFDKTAAGWESGKTLAGIQSPGDVEASPDGSIYVADTRGAPPNIKRFDSTGKLLKTIKLQMPATGGAGAVFGIGVDLDCNIWATNAAQRNLARYSPAGKLLGTATSGDLIGQDIAVGPTGDLYVFDSGTRSVIHFTEDKKPQAAVIPSTVVATKGAKGYVARIRYALTGVACPAQIGATATLVGKGVAGKAIVKVAADRFTTIEIPLAAGALKKVAGTTVPAVFKIVLKTNGRNTTQVRAVKVSVPK